VERQVGFDEENDGADFEVVRNIRNWSCCLHSTSAIGIYIAHFCLE
jgi:hypothetical protein